MERRLQLDSRNKKYGYARQDDFGKTLASQNKNPNPDGGVPCRQIKLDE